MAEEQLTLVDGMSPSLRRIYQEAEKLNRRILTLKSNIKTLEKPTSMSYLKRELKSVETQAKAAERALKAMKAAEMNNARYGAFKVGANGRYYLNGMQVRDADRLSMAEAYNRNVQNAQLRRNRLLWENGRLVNGLTFDERLANLKNSSKMSNIHIFDKNLNMASEKVSNFGTSLSKVAYSLSALTIIISALKAGFTTITKPVDKYQANLMRTNLTSDNNIAPRDMMKQLYDTAIRTRSDAQGTMMLYNRIAMSGVRSSNEDIRRFVETFNKTMMISGTSGQENRAVMLQLAQGMGSNRLGGDEFRSIAEQAPMFKYMLAKGMGVNPGALKEMGAQGKLTADAIMQAMRNVQELIDKIAQDAPLTIDQIFIIMQSKWEKIVTEQMSGYIAIRDLLKQISDWMDTAAGQEAMNQLVNSMNILIIKTVTFIKWISKPIVFILTHLEEIRGVLKMMAILWLLSQWQVFLHIVIGGLARMQASLIRTITQVGALGYAFMNAGALSQMAMTSMATNIKGVGVALHTWIPELLIILGLMLAITKLIPAIKNEIDTEKYINDQLRQQGFTAEDIGKASRYQVQQKGLMSPGELPVKMTKGAWDALKESERLREQYKKEHPKEGTPEYYAKMNADAVKEFQKLLENVQGVMNSSKNIPMSVKGGKLDSVGRINDDINLNKDSLEMLKAVAERTWIMQNEVTVPQKVDVNVNNISELEPESIANMLNEGSKIAIASSMRGAYA